MYESIRKTNRFFGPTIRGKVTEGLEKDRQVIQEYFGNDFNPKVLTATPRLRAKEHAKAEAFNW
jgi:hypothetical protein